MVQKFMVVWNKPNPLTVERKQRGTGRDQDKIHPLRTHLQPSARPQLLKLLGSLSCSAAIWEPRLLYKNWGCVVDLLSKP